MDSIKASIMKTTKILLSILGVALATVSFGQLMSLPEISDSSDPDMGRYMEQENEVLFYTAEYNPENGRTTHWLNYRPGLKYIVPEYRHDDPAVSRTYFGRDIQALYEKVPVVEQWMTIPFGNSLEDSELRVEDWMITPFESDYAEEALDIEPWMTESWI